MSYKRLALVDPKLVIQHQNDSTTPLFGSAPTVEFVGGTALTSSALDPAPSLESKVKTDNRDLVSSLPDTDLSQYYERAQHSIHPDSALLQVLQFTHRDLECVLNDPT